MKLGLSILILTSMGLALASPALAADEEIVLDDGRTGLAKVLATTKDSATFEFLMKGKKVKITLAAARLDPHCFYDIRRRHMEDTAENHLWLAVFCAKNDMWNRGQLQMDMALSLDEAYVEKMKATPGMREGVAESIIEAAKKHYDAGDMKKAEHIAERVMARFADLPVVVQAQTLLALVEEKRREQADAKEAAAKAAMDEAAKKAAEKVERAIKPLKATYELGTKLYDRAIQEKNQSAAMKTYESAAHQFTKVLRAIDKVKVELDPAQVERAQSRIRGEAARAYLKAGGIALHRGSYKDATGFGNKALEVDPGNQEATAFLSSVETAVGMDDTFGARYQRGRRRAAGGRR